MSGKINTREKVIEVKQISKRYDGKTVLDNVSFTVYQGTIHGFIGPNGAGKTTTLNIIVRLVLPSQGDVYVEGKSVLHNPRFNENLGIIPAEPRFPAGETVRDYILDLAELSSENWNSQEKQKVLKRLREFLNSLPSQRFSEEQTCNSLSTGQKKALQVLGLTLARPQKNKILLLDEVFNGLDPSLRHDLLQYLIKIVEEGGTIFLSSHILADLEKMAALLYEKTHVPFYVTMIKNGTIVHTGVYTGSKSGDLEKLYEEKFIEKGQKSVFSG